MSVCTGCERELPTEAFRPHNRKCRECEATQARERRRTGLHLEAKRRYQQSEKGKAVTRQREERSEVREQRRLFSASPAGKARQAKYLSTDKGKATRKVVVARHRHTEKDKASRAKHEARRRGWLAGGPALTGPEWSEIVGRHNHRCFYCKEPKPLTMDHVIPISKGGRHAKENIVPACADCNRRKSDKIWLLC